MVINFIFRYDKSSAIELLSFYLESSINGLPWAQRSTVGMGGLVDLFLFSHLAHGNASNFSRTETGGMIE